MKLAGFAEHAVVVRGGWVECGREAHRWVGTLRLPVPAFLVALMSGREGTTYRKSHRLPAGEVDIELLEPRTPVDWRYVTLIGRSMGLHCIHQSVRRPARFLDVPAERRFTTAQLADWTAPDEQGPTIRLLVLAASDVATRRCRIWSVKRRHRAALPEAWVPVLTRTRWGRVAF